MNFATILGNTLSWATLIGQVLVIAIVISLLFFKHNKLISCVKKYGVLFASVVVLTSIVGSLCYSDILGYEPCKLCWYQRILMYPQIVILGLGMYIRDRNATLYALVLSILGMMASWYHYLMQLGFVPAGCDVVGYSVSCAKVFTMHLGYITIPLMAFTAFVMITVFLVVYRIGGEEK
mgnify:FL=1